MSHNETRINWSIHYIPEDNAPKAIASFPRTILFDIICHYVLNFKNLVM